MPTGVDLTQVQLHVPMNGPKAIEQEMEGQRAEGPRKKNWAIALPCGILEFC